MKSRSVSGSKVDSPRTEAGYISKEKEERLLSESPNSESEITFVRELKQLSDKERQTRQLLQNVLSKYDVSPWLYKRRVKIDESSVGTSGSDFITLSTAHIGDNLGLLSEFIHEQIHRITFETHLKERNEAIRKLKSLYPDPPSRYFGIAQLLGLWSKFRTYIPLVVNWLELDAMIELVGEETARQLTAEEDHYTWVNERVLEDTDEIGIVLAKHDLIITPEKGLHVETDKE